MTILLQPIHSHRLTREPQPDRCLTTQKPRSVRTGCKGLALSPRSASPCSRTRKAIFKTTTEPTGVGIDPYAPRSLSVVFCDHHRPFEPTNLPAGPFRDLPRNAISHNPTFPHLLGRLEPYEILSCHSMDPMMQAKRRRRLIQRQQMERQKPMSVPSAANNISGIRISADMKLVVR